MTSTQVEYLKHLETRRHNEAQEEIGRDQAEAALKQAAAAKQQADIKQDVAGSEKVKNYSAISGPLGALGLGSLIQKFVESIKTHNQINIWKELSKKSGKISKASVSPAEVVSQVGDALTGAVGASAAVVASAKKQSDVLNQLTEQEQKQFFAWVNEDRVRRSWSNSKQLESLIRRWRKEK